MAEVTSLGLVQMTRKKIGLGLLETFSEPCEVCAGRGVIVHHDPVAKHRTSSSSSSGRRSRGSSNGSGRSRSQKSDRASEPEEQGAPVNTEGAKSALAKIAASTIAGHEHDAPAAPHEKAPAALPASLDQLATVLPEGPRGAEGTSEASEERARKPRRRRANDSGGKPSTGSAPTNDLLDSVLSALPEPKAPGQGRSRRRVSTAALQGTAVRVNPTADES